MKLEKMLKIHRLIWDARASLEELWGLKDLDDKQREHLSNAKDKTSYAMILIEELEIS